MPLTSEQFLTRLKQLMKDMHSTHVEWYAHGDESVVSNPLSKFLAKQLQDRLMRLNSQDVVVETVNEKEQRLIIQDKPYLSLWENKQSSVTSVQAEQEAEWEAAKTFFNVPANQVKGKFRKKAPRDAKPYNKFEHKLSLLNPDPKTVRHSFVWIAGQIFRIANGEYKVSEGRWGAFKVMQDRQGKVYGLKIYNPVISLPHLGNEPIVGRRVGLVKADMRRTITNNQGNGVSKFYKEGWGNSKAYLAMNYLGEQDLSDLSEIEPEKLSTPAFGLPIMMDCANQIQAMHDARMIHGDVKFGNFILDHANENHPIGLVDFGLSHLLEPGESFRLLSQNYGTEAYMTPELKQTTGPYRYSFEIDVHALGIMLNEIKLCPILTSAMIRSVDRIPLSDVRSALIEEMRLHMPLHLLSGRAKRLMADFDKENEQLINWVAEKSGTQANQWLFQHSSSGRFLYMVGFNLPPGVEEKLKAVCADCVNKNLIRTAFRVDKLRCVMIHEKRQQKLKHIVLTLQQQAELTGLSIESTAVKSMGDSVVLTTSPEQAAAMQQALTQLEIPFMIQDVNNNHHMKICILDYILTMVGDDPTGLMKQIAEHFKVCQTSVEAAAPGITKLSPRK